MLRRATSFSAILVANKLVMLKQVSCVVLAIALSVMCFGNQDESKILKEQLDAFLKENGLNSALEKRGPEAGIYPASYIACKKRNEVKTYSLFGLKKLASVSYSSTAFECSFVSASSPVTYGLDLNQESSKVLYQMQKSCVAAGRARLEADVTVTARRANIRRNRSGETNYTYRVTNTRCPNKFLADVRSQK